MHRLYYRLYSRRPLLTCLVVLLGGTLLTGCASSGETKSETSDPAQVVGVWEYRSYDSPLLGEGVLQITLNQGHLEGQLRDSRIGRVPVRVSFRNSNLNLSLRETIGTSSSLTVTGHVEDETFTAFLRRPTYDVSTSQDVFGRRAQSSSSGSLFARRVRAPEAQSLDPGLGCTGPVDLVGYRCD